MRKKAILLFVALVSCLAALAPAQALEQGTSAAPSDSLVFVAGTIRYRMGRSDWALVEDEAHQPLNITRVSATDKHINVHFNLDADKVITFIAVPDDTYSEMGYTMGVTAGLKSASIVVKRNQSIGGPVAYAQNRDWTLPDGFSARFREGVLTLTHPDLGEGALLAVTAASGLKVAVVDSGPDFLHLSWYDSEDRLLTAPEMEMKAHVTRSSDSSTFVNPKTLRSNTGNIWIFGVFGK